MKKYVQVLNKLLNVKEYDLINYKVHGCILHASLASRAAPYRCSPCFLRWTIVELRSRATRRRVCWCHPSECCKDLKATPIWILFCSPSLPYCAWGSFIWPSTASKRFLAPCVKRQRISSFCWRVLLVLLECPDLCGPCESTDQEWYVVLVNDVVMEMALKVVMMTLLARPSRSYLWLGKNAYFLVSPSWYVLLVTATRCSGCLWVRGHRCDHGSSDPDHA
jgi:hypothetical protein